ncbi:MAG: flagellar export chaperone FliS [Planctomycetes bacterium]|nr:flagellar export chaperone FliS [Planctomycetota bacterium]MCB9920463.1 flagellar export chaperone FliS [Planctomycetota bacterium]
MQYANAAETYRRNQVLNASPEKLIVMLYDGAIGQLSRAHAALQSGTSRQSAEVGIALGKAMAIIGELRSSLDTERGGDIAQNLDRLYDYCLDGIFTTNVERKPEPIEAPIRVMRTLKEGWDAIVAV